MAYSLLRRTNAKKKKILYQIDMICIRVMRGKKFLQNIHISRQMSLLRPKSYHYDMDFNMIFLHIVLIKNEYTAGTNYNQRSGMLI